MSKKKKRSPQNSELIRTRPVPVPPPSAFLAPRHAVAFSVAVLVALWLIQFWGVLTGGGNLWNDVIQLEYPFRYFARAALMRGEFPHWNPYTFGGMPFFATGAGIFYPLGLPLSFLPVGDAAFWRLIQASIVIHVLIAGVAMFAYLRFKGRTNAAAVFGAAAFMFGGYMITHVIHLSIIVIAAWLPLLLMLLERGVCEKNMKCAVAGGLILGAVMQAGHAQVMFYAVGFLFTCAVYFALTCRGDGGQGEERRATRKGALVRCVVPASVFFAIAAGLCLVQYLPMFEAGGQTSRISYTIKEASEGSLQFAQLITALMPKFFGGYTGNENVPAFWLQDSFRHGNHNYWETSFYFGISTLLLSIFMFRKIGKDRSTTFAAAWILLSFLIALGGNFFFYKLLFSLGIPGFNSFRHTPRILFVWGFLFPVMAAAVLDSLEEFKSSGRLKIVSLSICGAAAVFGMVTAAGGLKQLFPQMNASEVLARFASEQGVVLMMNALLFGIVLTLFFTGKIGVSTVKVLIIACLAIDMSVFAAGQHITRDAGAHAVFARARGGAERIRNMRKDDVFRINTRQYIVNPGERLGQQTWNMTMERNQGYVSGIETTDGYNPFRLKYAALPFDGAKFNTMLDLMNVREYVNPNHRGDGGSPVLDNRTYLPRAKLFYRAKVVGLSGADNDSLVAAYMNGGEYDHRNEVVVTDEVFSKFTGVDGTGSVKIAKHGLNRMELDVNTDREAILWLSEIWYPAWKAEVNGVKTGVHRVNHSFRAVIVPPGQSKVVFKFDSALFNIGAAISLLTLLSALGYLLLIIFKSRTSIYEN